MGHEITNLILALAATLKMACMTGLILVPVLLVLSAFFSKR